MSNILALALAVLIGGTLIYVLVMQVFVAALKPYFKKKN